MRAHLKEELSPPLLANIYLNNFDWLIARKFQEHPARYGVKDSYKQGLRRVRQRHKKCQIIRYADDWVILCKDIQQAESLLTECKKYLKHVLKLELEGMKIGLTKFQITESKIPHRWKAGISKYTFEGRQYLKNKNWKEKNARGTLYSINSPRNFKEPTTIESD